MQAILYLPGQQPKAVSLLENTARAAAQLLGVCAATVFSVEEETGIPPSQLSIYGDGVVYDGTNENPEANAAGESLLGGWCDFHGRILIVTAA